MLKMLSHCLFMTHFIELADQAEKAIRDVFPPTPLQRNEHLSAIYDADIWLKREDLSPVRSYKLRGAFNAMRKFSDKKAFVCASAGNHAQGVAFMCRQLKVNGIIFMPVTTPQQKIQKTQIFGGEFIEVRLTGDYFDDCLHTAQTFCEKESLHFLSPFDDENIMSPHQAYRVQTFSPPSGKIKLGRAKKAIDNFIKECFVSSGEIKEIEYPKSPSKWNCGFCPFKEDQKLCGEGIKF